MDEEIRIKRKEIIDGVAEASGVEVKNVELILDALSLDGALKHRALMESVADEIGLPSATRRLNAVTIENIRIACGSAAT